VSAPATYDRYPGARSFADSDLDRRLFCGRTEEKDALLHLILVERLVVLYGRSGMGKTSLLNAGVAQSLRERGFFPLRARINDPVTGPVQTIVESVQQAAIDAGVELIAPDRSSLWQFFRSAELWSGDELLTPVLILDQFEELFTIHGPAERRQFVDELATLVRGAADRQSAEFRPSLGAFRTVISIREDFLGHLEELSSRIPNILHKRFRVSALTRAGARTAMVEPAAVADAVFATAPFAYEPATLEGLLDFLSARAVSGGPGEHDVIDPFHLQLVCQHAESVVRSKPASGQVLLTLNDLGGESGLRQMLRTFYVARTRQVAQGFARQRVERLIERGLISAQGRRLSLEEGDIQQRFRVPPATLSRLVAVRLLRADTRVGSTYYEISHDTLVAPITAARQAKRRSFRRRLAAEVVLGALVLTAALAEPVERAMASLDFSFSNVLAAGIPPPDSAPPQRAPATPVSIAVSADGDTVARGFGDGSVRISIRHRGHEDLVLSDPVSGAVAALAFDPAVSHLAIGRADGSLEIRSLESFAEQSTVPAQGFRVGQVLLNRDSHRVAFLGSEQFRLFEWSERRARPVIALPAASLSMESLVAFDRDELLFLDSAGRIRCLRTDRTAMNGSEVQPCGR
jgi:hypothetical protein